jgi:PKD repeat protein
VSFTDTSSAGSYPIASWSWNFGDGATSSQQNPTHAYSDNGAYTVRLTVVDSGGQSASASLQVTVQNVPPTAEAGPGRSCNVGETLSFSASFTDPGSADTHTFSWNFGDGSTATGHDVSHAYTAAGEYTLTLTVTDDDGGVGSDTARITVTAVPPTASFSFSPSAPLEGQTVSFTDTSSAGSYPIVSWSWNFGDGASSSQQNPTHAYSDNGAYTVSLSVADSIGASGSSSLPLVVTNAAPVVDAGPDRFARVGELISFSATIQDPGVLDSHTVAWDFGDGRGARGSTVQHGYSSPGAYTVTVTATDDEGAVGQDSLGVQVVAASGRTEEGRTQAAPTILLQAEYSGPSFASTDSSLSLSYLVQSADAGWGGAANVEGAQVVFQVWSVPSLSRTEIAASASADGRAAADVQLPAGTYLVSTGVFCPWATDVTRPTTSVVVAAGPGSLAAGAVRFAQGEAVWSLGFHLPDTSGDSGSVALTRASTSDGPRTIISDHIAGVEVSLTGVTVAGTCQIDGLHGDPFRLVVWRTRTGASFQLDAGSDVSVSGDIPAGQFALPPVVVPR